MTTAVRPMPLDVEAYEWTPTPNLAGTVSDFARMQVLVTLFDTDPDKWLDFIRRFGTTEELRDDVPFLVSLRERMRDNPALGPTMRRLVAEVAMIFAPRSNAS